MAYIQEISRDHVQPKLLLQRVIHDCDSAARQRNFLPETWPARSFDGHRSRTQMPLASQEKQPEIPNNISSTIHRIFLSFLVFDFEGGQTTISNWILESPPGIGRSPHNPIVDAPRLRTSSKSRTRSCAARVICLHDMSDSQVQALPYFFESGHGVFFEPPPGSPQLSFT